MAARVESRFTVPTGGAAASVSTGALTNAVTVTTPAASYFHSTAGGVSSWATTFQTQINAAVGPYPDNAASVAAMIGYGTWTGGWLCQEASGSLSAAFLGATMTASGTPTYRNTGAATGTDYAIGFDTNTDYFTGGDIYDVTLGDDLCVAWVGKFSSVSGANGWIVNKYIGWGIQAVSTGAMSLQTYDGTSRSATTAATAQLAGEWHVGIACIDRGAGTMRIGTMGLTSGTAVISSTTNIAAMITTNTADPFRFGASTVGNDGATTFQLAAAYIGTGPSCASGMSTGLSTALSNFRSAINSSFTVALSTTDGRYTISNSYYPFEIAWTSTAQRDVAGHDRDITYPQTAAQLAASVGYGDWTAGAAWLCNESSGDLAPAFLGTTMTAAGTPMYSNVGARGGSDKAVGFDTNTDYFTGGDVYDVTLGDDLVVLWVGKFSAVSGANGWIINKYLGWGIQATSTGAISLQTYDGTARTATTGTTAQLAGEWHVGIAVIDRAAGTMRVGTIGLRSGASVVSTTTSISAMVSTNTTDPFRFGASTAGNDGATTFQLSYAALTTGPSVASGMSANLATALTTFAASLKSQTGTEQARGLWFPGSPLNCDDHPSMAPEDTDLRASESPTGLVLGLSGNVKYVHTNVRWERCAVSQIREAEATYANGSLEVFFRDAVSGLGGHEWMTPCSPMQIYWSNAGTDELLGSDANDGEGTAGWTLVGVRKFSDIAKPSQRNWVGAWDVTFGRLVSEG